MNHQEIASLACSMMEEHGLMLKGWTFGFDNAVKRLGCTHFRQKKITMSRQASVLMTDAEAKQIILHEIAHALLPSDVKHGKAWKDLAKSIGYELGTKVLFEQHKGAVEESKARYAKVLAQDKARAARLRRRDALTGSTSMTVGSIVVFRLKVYVVEAVHRKFATVRENVDNGKRYKISMSHISQTVVNTPQYSLV